jgi:hypothetical protein
MTFEKPKVRGKPTPRKIAMWMRGLVEAGGRVHQHTVARQIRDYFGTEFSYRNHNHNWAIRKDILEEFRALTEETVVWSSGGQYWRERSPLDPKDSRRVR